MRRRRKHEPSHVAFTSEEYRHMLALAQNTLGSTGDGFMVVCSEGHICTGPYPSNVEAVEAAERMTNAGGCLYLPVPYRKSHQSNRTEDTRGTGQYL
jgi:hypothetical protein